MKKPPDSPAKSGTEPRPPAFKNTELGSIPADWEVKRLGEIGTPLMCKRVLKSQTADSGEIPFYKIGTFGQKADAFISRDLFESFKRQYSYPKKGDILLSAAGTIGRCVVFDGTPSYFQDSNIVWLANDERIVCNEFLYWLYQVAQWQTENGGSVSRLYNDILRETKVIVPPLSEQRHIATALSDADAWSESLDKLIEKKKLVKQGTMQALLSGKTRLPGFRKKWVKKTFGDFLIRIATGLNPRQNFKLNNGGNNYYVTIKDFGEGCINFDACDKIDGDALRLINERSDLRAGDMLFSSIGRVGDAYVIKAPPTNWNINESVFSLRPNTSVIDSVFMYYLVKSESVQERLLSGVTGSTLTGIKIGELREILCCFPGDLAEQKVIATLLSDMDAELASLSREKAKAEQIKQGMMQELLTGRVRLAGGEERNNYAT